MAWIRCTLVAMAVLAASVSPVLSMACWSGWGYRVDPESLAFQGPRLLLVTENARVAWRPGRVVRLWRLDPETGQIDRKVPRLAIRLRQPRLVNRHGAAAVDGVAAIRGEAAHLMFGLRKVGPNHSGTAKQEAFLRWACGRAG